MWASPSLITLAIWVRVGVRVTRDAHITRVLGMVMPKTRGGPYNCDTSNQVPGVEGHKRYSIISVVVYSVFKMSALHLVDAGSLPLLLMSFGYPRATKKVSIFAASMSVKSASSLQILCTLRNGLQGMGDLQLYGWYDQKLR